MITSVEMEDKNILLHFWTNMSIIFEIQSPPFLCISFMINTSNLYLSAYINHYLTKAHPN